MKGILRRHPVLTLLVPYAAGLLCGPVAFVLWTLGAAALFTLRGPNSPPVSAGALAAVLMAAAGLFARLDAPAAFEGRRLIRFEGRVIDGPWPSRMQSGGFLLSVRPSGRAAPAGQGRALRLVTEGVPPPGLEPGAGLSFPAEAVHDGKRILLKTKSRLIRVSRPAKAWDSARLLFRMRRSLRTQIDRTLTPRAASLGSSILLGIPGSTGPYLRDLFRRTGTAHLLAISGLHVGIVIVSSARLLRLCLLPGRASACAQIAVLSVLCLLTGGRTPVIRACLAGALHVLSTACGRAAAPAVVLFDAAFLILVFDPAALTDLSFELSFAGCAAILLFLRWERPLLGAFPGLGRKLLQAAGVSLCAWCGTAPLAAHHFNQIVLCAPLVNLAVIPLFAVLLSAGFGHLVLTLFVPPAAGLSGRAVESLTRLLVTVLEQAAAVLPGPVEVSEPRGTWMLLFYGVLILALAAPPPGSTRQGGADQGPGRGGKKGRLHIPRAQV